MTTLNLLRDVFVGEYGDPIFLTAVDDVGAAVDLSSYTGAKQVVATSPDTIKTVTWTASFVTTGSDGQIYFTPASGDIDRPGDWTAQIILNSPTPSKKKSAVFTMRVGEALS